MRVAELADARAALAAAHALGGRPVALVVDRALAAWCGPAFARELARAAAALEPAAGPVTLVLDCDDRAGQVLAGVRAGVEVLAFDGPAPVAARLAAIAAAAGARLVRPGGAALDLPRLRRVGVADLTALCRRWLGGTGCATTAGPRPSGSLAMPQSSGLLSGVRVLDLSQYLPGPFTALMLADLGGDVVKLEPPGGDPMRTFDPPDADGLCPAYKLVNAGKRVVTADLKDEAGRAAGHDLVAAADVLVESFRPGTLERLGLGRAVLEALNPRLVHVALSGFGQGGPYRLRAGHDLTYAAIAGAVGLTGSADRPTAACPPMADHAGATQAAFAVAAALFARERTGRGTYLDVSLMESLLGWQGAAIAEAARGRAPARDRALLTGAAAYYRTYRTADDRYLAVGALEPKFWSRFCETVGRPEWIARQDEPMPQDALTAEVAAHLATRSRAAWLARLDPVDCCVEPVLAPDELADHPQIAARGQVVTIPGDDGAPSVVHTLQGLRIDDGGPPPRRPPVLTTLDAVRRDWAGA